MEVTRKAQLGDRVRVQPKMQTDTSLPGVVGVVVDIDHGEMTLLHVRFGGADSIPQFCVPGLGNGRYDYKFRVEPKDPS